MTFIRLTLAACLALPALTAIAQEQSFTTGVNISDVDGSSADLFVVDNTVLDGKVCIGQGCTDEEVFGSEPVIIKNPITWILFDDTSSTTFPDRDWRILTNLSTGGDAGELFAIQDFTSGRLVFGMDGNAPSSALWIRQDGNIGIGTQLPTHPLHIEDPTVAAIRMHRNGGGGLVEGDWSLTAESIGFAIRDDIQDTRPFYVRSGAPTDSLVIEPDGDITMGAVLPNASLHVQRNNGSASIHVENRGGSPSAVREMFKMTNNGGSYFTLDNTLSDTTWFFVHEDKSPNRFIISDAVADGPEMILSADGVLTVPGGFVVGSTTLNVPDYVFSDDYALRPLAEVKRFIKDNSHLPEVPSAADIAQHGLDVSTMQMALLKKVEELTLYTLAQQDVIADLTARLERLE